MRYYNQNDYGSVKYDRPNTSKVETVKTSGCGVCCSAMVFNNLADKELYSVKEMAKFSLSCGARDNSGTNLNVLLKALCKKHKEFTFKTTNSEVDLINHLKSGGMAICNQGDKYNVFSSAGHFVVAYRMSGNNIEVLDPQMYPGKYDSYSRPKRIIKKTANGCIVSKTEIARATQDRSPAYFLVKYSKPKIKVPTVEKCGCKAGDVIALTRVRGCYKGYGSDSGRKLVKNMTADGRKHCTSNKGEAYYKPGTKVTVLQIKKISSGNIWIKTPSCYICIYDDKYGKMFKK